MKRQILWRGKRDDALKTLAYFVLVLTIAVSSCAAIVSVADEEIRSPTEEPSS